MNFPSDHATLAFWMARTMGMASAGLYVSLCGKTMSISNCRGVVTVSAAAASVASPAVGDAQSQRGCIEAVVNVKIGIRGWPVVLNC
jgi:hypothetical protein